MTGFKDFDTVKGKINCVICFWMHLFLKYILFANLLHPFLSTNERTKSLLRPAAKLPLGC